LGVIKVDTLPSEKPEGAQNRGENALTKAIQDLSAVVEAQRPKPEHTILGLFKQLGTVLTAGAVIGLFGKISGASDAKIATLTILTAGVLLVIIRRDAIQQRLKSSTIIILGFILLLMITLFSGPFTSFLLDRTISKATGIIEYTPKANDFIPRFPKLITDAHEEVWFTGISFYISLPAYKNALLRQLENGINVRFLIYNPLSPNLDDVAAGFSQTRRELLSECDVTIQNLRTLSTDAKARNTKGRLEIRLFSTVPKMRLYVFDRHHEDGLTFFIPHVDQQNSPNAPGFLARNVATGIAPAFIDGVERVWSKSENFESFLGNYDKHSKLP
jgi:hypothetical protein